MAEILTLPIQMTVDHILRAQGADPMIIRSRRPGMLEEVEGALQLGHSLLHPTAVYETYLVTGVLHNRIQFGKEAYLQSPLVAEELKNACSVTVCICTIGPELETLSKRIINEDPVKALALDALGSAAVEQLISETCGHFEGSAGQGYYFSQPLGPGLEGWTVEDGQPSLFNLVDGSRIGVSLTESCLMLPIKSASFVLGMSQIPFRTGSTCDFCSLKETCRYRGNHERH